MCSDGKDIRDNEGLILGRDLQPIVDDSTRVYWRWFIRLLRIIVVTVWKKAVRFGPEKIHGRFANTRDSEPTKLASTILSNSFVRAAQTNKS